MRIRIDFAEANNYLFDPIRNINPIVMSVYGEELKQILIDDYFNGADLAVNYIGYSLDNEYFEFDFMPS